MLQLANIHTLEVASIDPSGTNFSSTLPIITDYRQHVANVPRLCIGESLHAGRDERRRSCSAIFVRAIRNLAGCSGGHPG
jgi:hypothetical protein